jgi:superkiller protein 3
MILAVLMFLAQSLSEQGAEAMRARRFAEAERIYREMLKANPGEARLHLNLGLALHSGGKYADAIGAFEHFLKANPQPGPAHLLLGVARLKVRQHCQAIGPLEAARKWQSSPQVLIELGDAYFGCKRFADAAATFEALGPTPKGLQGAGLSYARLGRQKDAEAAFAKLQDMPPTPELHELVAEVRILEGRNDDAIEELDAALRLAPNDSRLERLRARTLWRAGRYEDARAAHDRLTSRWSHDPEFQFERGDTLVRLEGPEAGLPFLEQAVKAAPNLIAARGALGRALVQAGRHAAAIPHLEVSVTEDPTLLLPLSRAYKATGRVQDAARVQAEYQNRVGSQN